MRDLEAATAASVKRREEAERPLPALPALPVPGLPPSAAAATPPPAPRPAAGSPSAAALAADRVLEIAGSEARIRYQGGVFLVRTGTRLPGGAQVTHVSLDGVDVADLRSTRRLPFVIGEWR